MTAEQPLRTSTLVGRSRELDALTQALEGGARLTTITGPGGVGKTRLVEEALATLRETRGDIVPTARVDLSDVTRPEGLVDRVLEALGGAGSRERDVVKHLAKRAPLVLVLDPFDRLVGSASVLSEWLRAVPALSLVVVSRQVLRTAEEEVIEIGPLTDDAARIELFETIARKHRAGFVLAEGDRATALEIVRQLDGLPLAIELAASRMAVMSPPALLHRLRNRFEVLRRTSGEAGRHSALEASIAWSVELLGPAARTALAQCTVFRGGFSLEAAEAVLALGEGHPPVLDVLQSLRERSLLQGTSGRAGALDELRLELGQSVRAFVEPFLTRSELEGAEDRHATYFVEHAERWAEASTQRDGWRARARIAADRDNLLAVVERILGRPNVSSRSADRALRALVALGPVLLREGALAICASHLERGLLVAQGSGADPRLQARSLGLRAQVKRRIGDVPGAEKDLADALVLAHHTGEARVEGRVLVLAADIALLRGESGAVALTRAEEIAKGTGDQALAIECLGGRANELLRAHDLAGAELLFEEGLARSRRLGEAAAEIAFERRLATIDFLAGRLDRARTRAEAARAAAIEAHERRAALTTTPILALTRLAQRVATGASSEDDAALLALLEDDARGASEVALGAIEWALKGLLGLHHAIRGDRGEAKLLLGEATEDAGRRLSADLDVVFHLALARIEAQARRVDVARSLVQRATSRTEAALDPTLAAFLATDPLGSEPGGSALVALVCAVPSQTAPLASTPPASDDTATLRVGPGASWFRVGQDERVDLARRKPLRLILERLAAERSGPTPRHLAWDDLLAAGWPGERMRAEAGAHRVRVAISTLRKMGLRDVLRTEDEGYLLDLGVRVVVG